MKLPDRVELVDMWLTKYHNITSEEVIARHPEKVLKDPDWFRLYPCTEEQNEEWKKEVYKLLRTKYKIPARIIKRGWWTIDLQCSPYVKSGESPTTKKEFNDKYSEYLEPGFYGLAIDIPELTEYLDYRFQIYIRQDDRFKYSQIKLKFNQVRIYCNLKDEEEKARLELFCQQFVNKKTIKV